VVLSRDETTCLVRTSEQQGGMSKISDRIQNALDEARILVLGAQVLIGFEYRSFFEETFDDLPGWAKVSKLVALCTMLLAFTLIVLPSAHHRLVEGGNDSERLYEFTARVLGVALLAFAAGLGLEVAATRRSGTCSPRRGLSCPVPRPSLASSSG
jgi:hypothetical protein